MSFILPVTGRGHTQTTPEMMQEAFLMTPLPPNFNADWQYICTATWTPPG